MDQGLEEAARAYEEYKRANQLAMDTEKYGGIAPANTSLMGTLRDVVGRWRSGPTVEAGLETPVFTEPIAAYLKNPARRQDSQQMGLGTWPGAALNFAGGLVPETRGDALLAGAAVAGGGMTRAAQRAPASLLSSHPTYEARQAALGVPADEVWRRAGKPYQRGQSYVGKTLPRRSTNLEKVGDFVGDWAEKAGAAVAPESIPLKDRLVLAAANSGLPLIQDLAGLLRSRMAPGQQAGALEGQR